MNKMLEKDLSFYFRKMEQLYLPHEAEDVYGVIKMMIDVGGSVEEWYIHLDAEKCQTTKTPCASCNVKLSMTKETFIKTFLGLTAMEMAYNNGSVIVEGDVDFAAFLIICFPKPQLYDSWLYHLEDAVIKNRVRQTNIVYKFEIENTLGQVVDTDESEPVVLAPSEQFSKRFVMIDQGTCRVLPENTTALRETVDVRLKDKDLLDFVQGTISIAELASRSNDTDTDLPAKLSAFKELFTIAPMRLAD